MMQHDRDDHFRAFAQQLRSIIARYGEVPEEEVSRRQRQQIEDLLGLETEFRRTLIKHPWGAEVYRAFVVHITKERRNILAARPFFRERQTVFRSKISNELKAGNEKGLYPFHVNYHFIRFALGAKPWAENSRIAKLERAIAALRHELVEMNMPLAINRARIFWRKTPESHLSYMDFVNIAAEGLVVAVDKFCPAGNATLAGVAIGRMVGFFIEEYSGTLLHFFPADKRKLYRGNKVTNRFLHDANSIDWEAVAESVNQKADPKAKTDSNEIAHLVLAASTVSADALVFPNSADGDGDESFSDRYAAPEELQPDRLTEEHEARGRIRESIDEDLTMLERKYLQLKGVDLDSL